MSGLMFTRTGSSWRSPKVAGRSRPGYENHQTGGRRGEVREYGRIANTPAALRQLARKLGQEGGQLRFCYEDGVIPARRYRFC